jgi:hypothetical protein
VILNILQLVTTDYSLTLYCARYEVLTAVLINIQTLCNVTRSDLYLFTEVSKSPYPSKRRHPSTNWHSVTTRKI